MYLHNLCLQEAGSRWGTCLYTKNIEASLFVYLRKYYMHFAGFNGVQDYLSNQILLDKSDLHSLMVKHSCGIDKKACFFSPSTDIQYLE